MFGGRCRGFHSKARKIVGREAAERLHDQRRQRWQ